MIFDPRRFDENFWEENGIEIGWKLRKLQNIDF